jgi:hypothetical protein
MGKPVEAIVRAPAIATRTAQIGPRLSAGTAGRVGRAPGQRAKQSARRERRCGVPGVPMALLDTLSADRLPQGRPGEEVGRAHGSRHTRERNRAVNLRAGRREVPARQHAVGSALERNRWLQLCASLGKVRVHGRLIRGFDLGQATADQVGRINAVAFFRRSEFFANEHEKLIAGVATHTVLRVDESASNGSVLRNVELRKLCAIRVFQMALDPRFHCGLMPAASEQRHAKRGCEPGRVPRTKRRTLGIHEPGPCPDEVVPMHHRSGPRC